MKQAAHRDITRDAVVLVPGIMGSELVEAATDRVLWGIADPRWYVSAWCSGESLKALAVTDEEREGRTDRVEARRLLQTPAFAPVLRGIEPYTALTTALRRVLAHPAALLEFPYDWRLSVRHNARELAAAAEKHLRRWRRDPRGSRDSRLVLVAHSMGGLIARYCTNVLGGDIGNAVRATIVIGTPFYGSVKAAYILNSGRGTPVPLPRRRLRALGRTLPGLHDLLPTYRCVDEGATARHLNLSDITALGGDPELAAESRRVHQALRKVDSKGMRALVGVDQPTMQSLILRDGVMQEQYYTCERYGDGALRRLDRRGDSTVYRDSASGGCIEPAYLPQSHGAVANTEEAASFVCSILTERPLGPPMGVASLGLDVPDVVVAGESLQVTALGVDSPNDVRGFLVDVESNQRIGPLLFGWRSDMVTAQAVLPTNGIYRVEVKAGASSAVTQMVMAIAPEHSTESESPL